MSFLSNSQSHWEFIRNEILVESSVIRKGRWTIEEEDYAKRLIAAFRNGQLCLQSHEEKLSMGNYLARKLSCDLSRVSSKFSDSCELKEKYNCTNNLPNHISEDIICVGASLSQSEKRFRRKLHEFTLVRRRKREILARRMFISSVSNDANFKRESKES
mmetsp:Transcript_5585/g.5774  ORF Transcript_5585/g.5774 Transcript_5585/m.5774 type:complete len:159 (+) Transcript_5585:92-568(+)